MPDEHGNETREEALERIRIVRATQIFGDTPTDPTIGDVVVPAHDEEGANVAAAEVDAQAEDGSDEASDLSPEEAKRQLEPLDAESVDEAADDDDSDDADVLGSDSDEDDEDDDDNPETRNAAEVVDDIKNASSVEEVDALAAERPDAVTVQRAADAKREELS